MSNVKKTIKIIVTVIFVVLILLINAHFTRAYKGDGVFTDTGPWNQAYRYWLSLDEVDISKPSKKKYIIGRLPRDTAWRFQFVFKTPKTSTISKQADSKFTDQLGLVIVIIKIYNKLDNKILYEYSGPLYEDGVKNGKYYRYGLSPGVMGGDGFDMYTLSVPIREYGFTENKNYFDIIIPFIRDIERVIEIEVLKPHRLTLPYNSIAEIVLKGGGW